jgi:hypothetical protein
MPGLVAKPASRDISIGLATRPVLTWLAYGNHTTIDQKRQRDCQPQLQDDERHHLTSYI